MALCCPGCLSDHPAKAKSDKAERLAMLAENLDENDRLFRAGKITSKQYTIRKRDAKHRMAEIRRGAQ